MKAWAICAIGLLALGGCRARDAEMHARMGGDPHNGALMIVRASCGTCHVIPGIELATGQVGPPLTHFAQRTIVAGVLANTPDNLTLWIANPQSVVPGNAMPSSGLTDQQARDVAAYLYTLR